MVVCACSPSYSGGWGRRIAWTWKAEIVVSWNHAAALQAGWQSKALSQNNNNYYIILISNYYILFYYIIYLYYIIILLLLFHHHWDDLVTCFVQQNDSRVQTWCWFTVSAQPLRIVISKMHSTPWILFFLFFETEFRSCYPGWSAMARSRLTTTSASWVQAILLPQPPE